MYLAFLCVGLIILYFVFFIQRRSHKEGFETKEPHFGKFHEYIEIYDDFYSFMHDDLFYDEQYYTDLCKIMLKYLNHVYNNHLCIGIKHGGHINELLRKNMKTLSVSISPSIVDLCKHKYSENNYQYVSTLTDNPYIFNDNQFTHISIIDSEIYYLPELYSLFNNCGKWIIHKGYLCIQMYNSVHDMERGFAKAKYDSKALVEYNYSANFKKTSSNNHYFLIETLKYKDNTRKNTHTLYYYEPDFIVQMLNEIDFSYVKNHEINDCEKLWIFQKH